MKSGGSKKEKTIKRKKNNERAMLCDNAFSDALNGAFVGRMETAIARYSRMESTKPTMPVCAQSAMN